VNEKGHKEHLGGRTMECSIGENKRVKRVIIGIRE
jgi:hypothetical protein